MPAFGEGTEQDALIFSLLLEMVISRSLDSVEVQIALGHS